MTVKDMCEILSFLEVAQRTTERSLRESIQGSVYYESMTDQLNRLNDLIKRLEEMKI